MKKKFFSAIAALFMTSAAMADGIVTTTYVLASNKTAITNAINETIGAGNTHIVVLCKSLDETGTKEGEVADGTTSVNLNKCTLQSTGTLILRSNQTDIDNLPELQLTFETFAEVNTESYPSLVFENLALDQRSPGGAGYIVGNKNKDMYYGADSIVFRNCNIKSGRSIYREENQKGSTAANAVDGRTSHHIAKFIFEGNKAHQMCIKSTDAWRPFYFVAIPDYLVINNNIFYDMPYAAQLINFHSTALADGTSTSWNIYNNTFLMAGSTKKSLTLINAAAYVDPTTEFNVYNNLFLGEEQGLYAVPEDVTDGSFSIRENYSVLLNCTKTVDGASVNQGGYLTSRNNYFSKYYESPAYSRRTKVYETQTVLDEDGNEVLNEDGTVKTQQVEIESTPYDMDVYEDLDTTQYSFTFDKFYDPTNSDYRVLNSDPLYTAGASAITDMEENPIITIPTCVGAPLMYVDAFPVTTNVDITVEAPEFASYEISPAKSKYFVNDEVTVTINAGQINNKYLTVTPTITWSDDATNTEASRKFTLTEEGLSLKATVSVPEEIISAFNFATAGGNLDKYEADVCNKGYRATITEYIPSSTTEGDGDNAVTTYGDYVLATAADKNFQSRVGKFGEDAEADQLNVISRRTAAGARTTTGAEYAVVEFSTAKYKDVEFSCFVGTDNYAYNKQNIQYSVDGKTWNQLASINLADGERQADFSGSTGTLYGWSELKASLPEECSNKTKVYVRIIGTADGDPVYVVNTVTAADPDFVPEKAETFEYIADVLITGTKDNSLPDGVDIVEAATSNVAAPAKKIVNGSLVIETAKGTFNAAGAQVK